MAKTNIEQTAQEELSKRKEHASIMKMSKYLNCPTYGCALSERTQECDPGTRQRGIVCTRLQDSEVHWALKVRVEWPVMSRLGTARTDTVSQVEVRRFAPRRVWESATKWVRRKEYSQITPNTQRMFAIAYSFAKTYAAAR